MPINRPPICGLPEITPAMLKAIEAAQKKAAKVVTNVPKPSEARVVAQECKANKEEECIKCFPIFFEDIDSEALDSKTGERLIAKSKNYIREVFNGFSFLSNPKQYALQFARSYLVTLQGWAQHEKKASTKVIKSVQNQCLLELQNTLNEIYKKIANEEWRDLRIFNKGQHDAVQKQRQYIDKAMEVSKGKDPSSLSPHEKKLYGQYMRTAEKCDREARKFAGFIIRANNDNRIFAEKNGLLKKIILRLFNYLISMVFLIIFQRLRRQKY